MPNSVFQSALPSAILIGLSADLLIPRDEGTPGLNLFLFFAVVALGIRFTTTSAGRRPSPEAWGWILGGLLLATPLFVLGSEALHAFSFLAAAAAFTMPALRGGAPWIRSGGVGDILEAVGSAVLHALLGPIPAVLARRRDETRGDVRSRPATRSTWSAVLLGLLFATPLILIFGGLFAAADPVFAGLIARWTGSAAEDWVLHLVLTGVFGWLASGYLSGFLSGTRLRDRMEGTWAPPSVGILEAGIAVGAVNLLFALFVGVQFRALLGGADWVEATPGLTYSEYTRQGFGQLAWASFLVLPSLLGWDWLLRGERPGARRTFRLLGGIQLFLLGIVILSAFQRVRGYQEAFGLTESRLFGTILLGWIAAVAAWMALTVLRGQRERFALPALLLAFSIPPILAAVNPDAWIARSNLARSAAGGPRIDVAHLGELGADAVPILIAALPDLEPEPRCRLARRILERWSDAPEHSWRSWNIARSRARAEVAAALPVLRTAASSGGECPVPQPEDGSSGAPPG